MPAGIVSSIKCCLDGGPDWWRIATTTRGGVVKRWQIIQEADWCMWQTKTFAVGCRELETSGTAAMELEL